MSEELWDVPSSWCWTALGDIAEWSSGGTPKATESNYYGGNIPWLVIGDLNEGIVIRSSKTISDLGLANSSAKMVEVGSILVAMYGSIGKLGIAGIPCATNQAIAFTTGVSDAVLPQYLFRYLQAAKPILFEQGKGGAQANISQTVLKAFPIALAPLAEQRRIVARLEAVLQKLNACEQRLANIPTLLKRFRQSIIAGACSGRLTADWRQEDISSESNDLPSGWNSVCVGDVIESIKYGTAQKCTYQRHGVPVLRIPNVVKGMIDQNDLKYADLPARERRSLQLSPGDILLIRSNGSVSLVGKCAVVHESESGFAYAGYLIRIRPKRDIVRPEFLDLVLGSYEIRLQIELQARSTSGVNNINAEEVRALRFLLPPITEQDQIVRRVKALFALADVLDGHYAKAAAGVGSIARSIFAKAFRGELLPTEAELAGSDGGNFEPADELLARVHARYSTNGHPRRIEKA